MGQEGLCGHIPVQSRQDWRQVPSLRSIMGSLQVTTDYTGIGKIQYIAGERSLPILDSEYTDKVVLKLLVPDDQVEEVKKAITEGTNGRAGLEKNAELYFAKVNGEVKTFEK